MLAEKFRNTKIILASKSPRRQELLKGLEIPFEIRTKDTDESYDPSLSPMEVPACLSEKKAAAFEGELEEGTLLITSDTIVCIGNEILEKPKDKSQAIEMLQKLSGKTHSVYTGLHVCWGEKKRTLVDETKVTFKELSMEEIEFYLDNFQPYDKAGSYGVQEWIGYIAVEKMEGSFYTVMGLPLAPLYKILKNI
jgi:septum formation protein